MILARVVLLLVALMLSQRLGFSAKGKTLNPQNISETCFKLTSNSIQMEHICSTKVTLKMFILTRSPLFKPKQIVSLYLSEDRTASLITVYKSTLHSCKKLEVIDTYLFKCMRNDRFRLVVIKESKLYCFPHHLYVTNLVAESCKKDDSGFSKYLRFINNTEYDIIHLGHIDQRGSTFHLPWRTLISLELMAMIVQYLFTQ